MFVKGKHGKDVMIDHMTIFAGERANWRKLVTCTVPFVSQFIYSQIRCFFRGNCANFPRSIDILIGNLLGAICNRREKLARFSCEFVLCRLKIVSLLSSAISFLNWNFNLELITQLVKLDCRHANDNEREANLFETTTTNFIKQNSKSVVSFSIIKKNYFYNILSNSSNFTNFKRNLKRNLHNSPLATHWGEQLQNVIPVIQFSKLLLHLGYRSN